MLPASRREGDTLQFISTTEGSCTCLEASMSTSTSSKSSAGKQEGSAAPRRPSSTMDHDRLVLFTAFAYAHAFFQAAPAQWGRERIIFDLDYELSKFPEGNKHLNAIRRTAQRHVEQFRKKGK
jgi:hypothetical protein